MLVTITRIADVMSGPRLTSAELAALLDALRPAPSFWRFPALISFGLCADDDNPDGWLSWTSEQAEYVRARTVAHDFGSWDERRAA